VSAHGPDNPLWTHYAVNDVADVIENLDAWRCPDCDCEFGPVRHHGEQMISVEVKHDLTCPWFQKARRS
jgi:hypothetical protein